MQWKATHIIKIQGEAPRRVMLNSGGFYTKAEWNAAADQARVMLDAFAEPTFTNPQNEPNGYADIAVAPLSAATTGASITPLRKEVARLATNATVRSGGKQRLVVITLLPGDVIELRPLGCRERRTLTIDHAWTHAGKLKARAAVAARKAARKNKTKAHR